MHVRSPLGNGIATTLTYAGIALAVAARDPHLIYYLTQSGARGIKTFARAGYNNKLELRDGLKGQKPVATA